MKKQLITATIMCAVCFAGMCFATEGDIPINDGVTASPQETEQKNNDVPSEPSAVTDPGGVQFSASQVDSVSADNGVGALTPEQAAAPRTMNQQTTGTHPDDIASRLSALRGGARGIDAPPSLAGSLDAGSLDSEKTGGPSGENEGDGSQEQDLLSALASGENVGDGIDDIVKNISDEGSDPSDPSNQGISGDRSSGGDAQDNGMDNGSFGEDSEISSEGDMENRESQLVTFSALMSRNEHFEYVQYALGLHLNAPAHDMIVTLFENMNSDLNVSTFGLLSPYEMINYMSKHYSDEANIAAVIAEAAPHKAAAIAAAVAEVVPSQAVAIAAAVAMAVPSQAVAIAAAVAEVEPSQAVAIAQAVANAVPNQTAAILKAVKAVETLTENDRDVLSEMMETYENPPDTEPPYQG